MIVCLLIPGSFTIAGAQLSPNRMLLLAALPLPCLALAARARPGKPTAVDILMLLSTVWAGLALIVNHGLGSLARSRDGLRRDLRRLSRRPDADPQHRGLPALLRAADLRASPCLLPFALLEILPGRTCSGRSSLRSSRSRPARGTSGCGSG